MESTALAVSRHSTRDYGPLRCVWHICNAINLLAPGQHLLTMYR